MVLPVRLAVRRLRLDLLICLAASLVLAAATLVLANAVTHTSEASPPPSWIGLVQYVRAGVLGLPILAGVILGASLVAAELDQGTSVFAWSIALSRCRWLADTAVAGVFMVLVVSVPIAGASRVLSSSLGPQLDVTSSPAGIDWSALLLVARPIVAFAITALAGIVLGRSLPTLLVALLMSCLVLGALEITFSGWREAQVTPIDLSAPGALYVGDRMAAIDGHLLSDQEAKAAAARLGSKFPEQYQEVPVGLTPQIRAWTIGCEVGVTLVAAAAPLVIAGVLIQRRRPT